MKNIIIIFLFMFVSNFSFANNLNIGSTSFNASNKTISFTISWDNSWRVTTGPSNWDAVWIFVKRQACSTTNIWASSLLSTTSADHTTSIGSGTNLLTVDATSDGMGVFIRRSALTTATGSIGTHTITLKLNASSTTSPAIVTTDNDNFKVMGLEMVYVPQGSFYLGDGRANALNFSAGNTPNTALLIGAANQNAGLGLATVYTSSFSNGAPSALPASFPLGYNGFYCMKYELGVSAYLEFINSLTYDQQARKLSKWSTTAFPNILNAAITGSNAVSIKVSVPGTFNTIPATFVQGTASYYKPIHELNWQDLASYLDWSGLRPMTEFEFEKACRGNNAGTPNNPVANEYPWGSTQITSSTLSANTGAINELTYVAGNNGVCAYSATDYDYHNPMRSGSPATATSNRVQAGATYYGIMEMGGNVYEQCVGGGNGYDYSSFTTINGDGSLTNLGLADVTGWPTYGGTNSGTILRGGGFNCNNTNLIQVSDRSLLAGSTLNSEANNNSRNQVGGRGVRTMSY
jgi:formylglycine-generating enzyme required for sulfatase activity